MKVYFETSDIYEALLAKLKSDISVNEETTEVDIEFKNGRGDSGPSAILDIVPKGTIAKRRAEEAAGAAAKAAAKSKDAPTAPVSDTTAAAASTDAGEGEAAADQAAAASSDAEAGNKKSLFG